MARPCLKEDEKRVVQVNIRLTIEENRRVCEQAVSCSLSPANWIRKKVFTGQFPKPKQSALDAAIYQELHKIGVNLNQATHRINRKEMPVDYLSLLMELLNILKKILTLLTNDSRPS